LEEVYGCKPDLTREGGSIPITLTFQVWNLYFWHCSNLL
jgi:hypothetical protein